MLVHKFSTSWDTGGTALEEVGPEKPETRARAICQEQQPVATKRYALFCTFGHF